MHLIMLTTSQPWSYQIRIVALKMMILYGLFPNRPVFMPFFVIFQVLLVTLSQHMLISDIKNQSRLQFYYFYYTFLQFYHFYYTFQIHFLAILRNTKMLGCFQVLKLPGFFLHSDSCIIVIFSSLIFFISLDYLSS